MIYLTSFNRAVELPPNVERLSAAVYQPKGMSYPKVAWTDIRRDGHWIRPRDFIGHEQPLKAYRDALMALYMERRVEAANWVKSLLGTDVALLCWCPYDRAAQRQLSEFGSFVCHTAVLSEFLSEVIGVPVWEDRDRRRMAVLSQAGM